MCFKIWRLILEAAVVCCVLQIQSSSSCDIAGSVAFCGFRNLRSVPALPPHVTHLFLEMNRIQEITAMSLSRLPNLQHLDLGDQRFPLVIRNNAFSKQTNLTTLVLASNRHLHLEPQAFAGLSNLKYLDLGFCNLNETVLSSNTLESLTSLETLDLFGNKIKRLIPAVHFSNLTHLKDLTLKLNPLEQICEEDLAAFQGTNFRLVNLNSVKLRAMLENRFDWGKCGNPFKNMTFETLDFSNNYLSLAGLKQFFMAIQGTRIDKLKLSGHYGKGFSFKNLPDPDSSTFRGLSHSSVQYLDLSKNMFFALEDGVFSPFRSAHTIDISQNSVNRIHENAFDGLNQNLRTLNLSQNLLGEIYSQTFASLTSLKVLDLSHNHIGALGYNSFIGLKKLEVLILTGNAIRTIGFPASLPRLETLKFDDNKLKSIYGIAQFANATKNLDVSNNRLVNLGEVYTILDQLKSLETLVFSYNPVERCIVGSSIGPNQLKSLHFDHVSLQSVWSKGQCLDLFHKLDNLLILSLTHNDIKTLPVSVFKGLKAVQKIDLSSNALTKLHVNVFPQNLQLLNLADNFIAEPQPENFETQRFIDLRGNRFHCGPGLKKFMSWIKETNVTLMGVVEEFTCEFPSNAHGVSLLEFYAQEEEPSI